MSLETLKTALGQELPRFDGVLLVHYDYFEHHPSAAYDKSDLYNAFHTMETVAAEQGKKVFVIGMNSQPTNGILRNGFHFISPEKTIDQRVADIANALGKEPGEISLIFGGILSNDCVYKHLVGMCRQADDSGCCPEDDFYADFSSKIKLGYGKLFPLLTEQVSKCVM